MINYTMETHNNILGIDVAYFKWYRDDVLYRTDWQFGANFSFNGLDTEMVYHVEQGLTTSLGDIFRHLKYFRSALTSDIDGHEFILYRNSGTFYFVCPTMKQDKE